MPVKFYQFGKLVGGSDGTSPVIPAEAGYGPPEQFDGTLGPAITTVTFSHSTKAVDVRNTHDTDSLEVSFDGGSEWVTLLAYQIIQENISVASIQLRPLVVGTTPTYEVIGTLSE